MSEQVAQGGPDAYGLIEVSGKFRPVPERIKDDPELKEAWDEYVKAAQAKEHPLSQVESGALLPRVALFLAGFPPARTQFGPVPAEPEKRGGQGAEAPPYMQQRSIESAQAAANFWKTPSATAQLAPASAKTKPHAPPPVGPGGAPAGPANSPIQHFGPISASGLVVDGNHAAGQRKTPEQSY